MTYKTGHCSVKLNLLMIKVALIKLSEVQFHILKRLLARIGRREVKKNLIRLLTNYKKVRFCGPNKSHFLTKKLKSNKLVRSSSCDSSFHLEHH